LTVNLPEGAVLTVNGQIMETTAGTQLFYTPELQPDVDFHYTLRVQLTRDGQITEETRDVTVRAGLESSVNFDAPVSIAYDLED
jgi:uncharacterized protein (TIGR03000 family)